VPQLVTLISNRPKSGAVLAGHSQGSVIAVAALLQLPEDRRGRVALMSFGTQLRSFYGRAFPSFFGQNQLSGLAESLTSGGVNSSVRWKSLWRSTDPIGYRVKVMGRGADGSPRWKVDFPGVGSDGSLRDPADLSPPREDFTDPPICRHSDYARDEDFGMVAEDLARSVASSTDV